MSKQIIVTVTDTPNNLLCDFSNCPKVAKANVKYFKETFPLEDFTNIEVDDWALKSAYQIEREANAK